MGFQSTQISNVERNVNIQHMKIVDWQTRVNFLTGVSTTEYTNANRLINLNRQKHLIADLIRRSCDEFLYDDPNYTDEPIELINLVASTQNYSLLFSEQVLDITKVEVTYDGTNWYKAEPYMREETILTSDATTINNNFSTTAPYYEVRNNNIYLYPIPTANVSSGLKVMYSRAIKEVPSLDDYTTGTVTTAASTAVVGSGTVWTSSMVGRYFEDITGQSGTRYKISTVTDATHLTLATAFTGTAAGSHSYKITSDDITIGFDEPFDDMAAVGVAQEWAETKDQKKAAALEKKWNNYAALLSQHYSDRVKDRKYKLQPAFENYD